MANAELKRGVIAKIQKARANGVTLMEIEDKCPECIGVHTIVDMLNARVLPVEVWEAVDKVMDELIKV